MPAIPIEWARILSPALGSCLHPGCSRVLLIENGGLRTLIEQDGLIAISHPDYDTPEITTRAFLDSGQANLLLDREIPIDCPVRLLHGLEDKDVPPSIAFRLGRTLRSDDVQTLLVKGGEHRLSRPGDLGLLLTTVAALIETL